jgi:NAD(P)-dependent dehydrogenase (short-subunit alcohol dehydrogenase family)
VLRTREPKAKKNQLVMANVLMLQVLWLSFGATLLVYLIRKYREYRWGRWRWRGSGPLTGKVFVITGASGRGLGAATALELAKRDATVVLACRSMARARATIDWIRRTTDLGELVFLELDLAYHQSIYAFVGKLKVLHPRFDCLINNAGVAQRLGDRARVTREGHEIHCGVNHLGHFLLVHLLHKTLETNNSRIVVVSSRTAVEGTIDFDEFGEFGEAGIGDPVHKLYNNSKLMNLYHARELYRRGHDVHVVCPGFCKTELGRDQKTPWYMVVLYAPAMYWILKSARQGAQNIVFAATEASSTLEKNPGTGYVISNVEHEKLDIAFDEQVSNRLWAESARLCGVEGW